MHPLELVKLLRPLDLAAWKVFAVAVLTYVDTVSAYMSDVCIAPYTFK